MKRAFLYLYLFSSATLFDMKKMIKNDGYVIKEGGIKQQTITTNPYCRKLFTELMTKLSQDQKNELFDYALDKTSYDMLKLLVSCGAQVDAPWREQEGIINSVYEFVFK